MSLHCTVLIPAYNTSEYIGEAIRSVWSQSYRDWDILVIDDGSTDCLQEIVEDLAVGKDISIFSLKKNMGVTPATRIGIELARGPIITVLDSDDKLYSNSLSSVVPKFSDPELGFAWSKFVCSNGRQGWSKPITGGRDLYTALTTGWWNASHQRFFRKETYFKSPGLQDRFKASSDFQLAVLLGFTKCKTLHIPEITYWYRVNRKGALSRDPGFQRKCLRDIVSWIKTEENARANNGSICS